MHPHSLKIYLAVCLLITCLTAIPLSVQADVVVLKNGDRITGRIVKMGRACKAYGNFPTEETSLNFLGLVRTRQAGQVSVPVQRAVLPFESLASTLEPS
jgi:hypothetical protein